MASIQECFDELAGAIRNIYKEIAFVNGHLTNCYEALHGNAKATNERFDLLGKQNLEMSKLLVEMAKADKVLMDDLTEMKRQYNHHLHQGNLTFIFNADRMK